MRPRFLPSGHLIGVEPAVITGFWLVLGAHVGLHASADVRPSLDKATRREELGMLQSAKRRPAIFLLGRYKQTPSKITNGPCKTCLVF